MDVSSSNYPQTANWINGIVPVADSKAVRLFCFPYAGGGASIFRAWAAKLGTGIEVYPIQLPGREGRWLEPPLANVAELVSTLAEVLSPLLRPPYAFFGHSMGAFVAFELARHIRRKGGPGPEILILSAARAPQILDPDPPIHDLPADSLLEELKRFDGIDEELLKEPEFVSLFLPTLRADLTLCESYQYLQEQPLECAISVYGAEHDVKVRPEQLAPWETQTSKNFRLKLFPGNHFFFIQDSHTAVMEAVREDLRNWIVETDDAVTSRAQLEQMIAKVWSDLLGVPQVGIDDNFFDLGGNSLLMVQAFGTLRNASPNTLSVLDLFRYPTIRSLASAIGQGQVGRGEAAAFGN
jgi:surfactin synthase thioesterase subunit